MRMADFAVCPASSTRLLQTASSMLVFIIFIHANVFLVTLTLSMAPLGCMANQDDDRSSNDHKPFTTISTHHHHPVSPQQLHQLQEEKEHEEEEEKVGEEEEEANYSGFVAELFHVDARSSSSMQLLPHERLTRAVQRSYERARRLMERDHASREAAHMPDAGTAVIPAERDLSSDGQSRQLNGSVANVSSPALGEYVIQLEIGTPSQKIQCSLDLAETFWTVIPCSNCTNCSTQQGPLFYTNRSSTFQQSNEYFLLQFGTSALFTSSGYYGKDTVTVTSSTGNPQAIDNYMFGCGIHYSGWSPDEGGIIGLGPTVGPRSNDFLNRTFAYCLVDFSDAMRVTSRIYFGGAADDALSSVPGFKSTPLVPAFEWTHGIYNVGLDAIVVGAGNAVTVAGAVAFDVMTTLTFLEASAYAQVKAEFIKQVNLPAVQTSGFDLCFDATEAPDVHNVSVPTLTLRFKGNVTLTLPSGNYLAVLDVGNHVFLCLLIAEALQPNKTVIGTSMQQNIFVMFKYGPYTLSYAPTDCKAMGAQKSSKASKTSEQTKGRM